MKYFFSAAKKIDKNITSRKLLQKQFVDKIYYLNNPIMMQEIKANVESNKIKNGDVIQIHAHGYPFMMGLEKDSDYNHTAFSLARLFSMLFASNPEIKLTLDLRFCNSSTVANGPLGEVSFAKDFSKALAVLNLKNIIVYGYRGELTGDNVLKQSAKGPRKTTMHARLEEVQDVFIGGIHIEKARKNLIEMCYSTSDIELEGPCNIYFREKNIFEREMMTSQIMPTPQALLNHFENISCEKNKIFINQIDNAKENSITSSVSASTYK